MTDSAEDDMTDTKRRWFGDMNQRLATLKKTRDELKLQMRLASMEAKARFAKLDKRLETEQLKVRKSLDALVSNFRDLRSQLSKGPGPRRHA